MSLNLNDYKTGGKKDFGRVEDGTYPARVVQVVGLGKHKATDWQTGKVKTYNDGNVVIQDLVMFTWEFPTERIEIDGESKPRWYSKEYTLSANEKANLTKVLAALGCDYDLSEAINRPCLVTIGSTSTGKAKVTGVTKLPKGMEVGELENPPKVFDPYDPDLEVWESLPAFMKSKIRAAEDFNNMKLGKLLDVKVGSDDLDDEIPF